MRTYTDGVPVSVNLPKSYKPSDVIGVPSGQFCSNCAYYVRAHCVKWLAPVRQTYWCTYWEKK